LRGKSEGMVKMQLAAKNALVKIQNPMTAFGVNDEDYLILNFTPRELRDEIAHADIRAAAAEALGEDQEAAYWLEFAEAARSALDIAVWFRSAPRSKTYPGKRVDPKAVKERVDLAAIVERYTQLRRAGRNLVGRCPLHSDRHPSLTVYPDQQSWHCFGCNRGGDVISFIMEVEHTDFLGAISILEGDHG
jgi:hypothetical protein